ncbi:MAG TPA: DUF6519 domain-containing protein [Actinomycetota bacterium]|nr:DUF6519 domain-containing protein [Actinomycetota bacterium]
MKADFSRATFRRERHFSSVRAQQGRVQLDADLNEQADITQYRDETTARDVVGPCGAPMHDAGFEITAAGGGISVGPGRMYVDGILCESEDAVPFDEQPDLPGAALPDDAGRYLFYLDVWQRHVTALEEPDLREVALGGPDTATRTRTVWQVRAEEVGGTATCDDFAGWAPSDSASTGRLRARATPAPEVDDECLVPPGAGFRRLENQLYRIEVHDDSDADDGPTFKWSRDNGSVAATLESITGMDLGVSDLGPDSARGLSSARWVELSDDERALRGETGVLVEVAPQAGALTVQDWDGDAQTFDDFGPHPVVRRWDSDGALALDVDGWIELEDGVEVQFAAGEYRTGDFWLVPARSLTGAVQWPRDADGPVFETRHGVAHHFCALALFDLASDGTWAPAGDCRALFPPLTELRSLFYVGGDGQDALPDVDDPTTLVELDAPLRVGVSNGTAPVAGARVRWRVTAGNGRLAGADADVEVATDDGGVSECAWEVDSATAVQTVEATLLDAGGDAVHVPIEFTATLDAAQTVAYDPGDCDGLAGAFTVQAALDRVARTARLYYAGGDGQEARPGQAVAPLRVVVASDCGPVEGATVVFKVTAGGGSVGGGGASANRTTGANGVASCPWQLGGAHRQEVVATLSNAPGATIGAPQAVTFVANASVATEVAFDPKNCAAAGGATTVQGALDALCKSMARERGIRIEGIFVAGEELVVDADLAASQLAKAQGIAIHCDADVLRESVQGKPVVILTVDIPWPGRAKPGTQLGTWPLVLAGDVDADGSVITWIPTASTHQWLESGAPGEWTEAGFDRLLAHLRILGNFVVDVDGEVVLDGELFAAKGERGAGFPTGDGIRGGDFEMWFHLVLR